MTESPLLATRILQRHYQIGENVVRALDGIDLNIRRGEFLTVVGSSGSGKSSLMHILGCLDNPTGGHYCVEGEDVSGWDDNRLSSLRNRRVGFVFQQFNLLGNLTVLENIALPLAYRGVSRDERQQRARERALQVGLGDRLHHRPAELSGGQAQRVAIARALANDPDVLLADEPTGNLDTATGKEIMALLLDLNRRGLTLIVVTHDPEIADMGTRRVTLRDGRIIDDSPGRLAYQPPEGEKPGDGRHALKGLGLLDLFRMGIKEGLLMHKMRTALTMLGIIIGVASVIAMSSFSLGSKEKQANQIRALGANMVRVVDRRLEGEPLNKVRKEGSMGLSRADFALLRDNVPAIQRLAALREVKVNVLSDRGPLSPRVLGVTNDYLNVNNLAVAEGRFFDEGDTAQAARVAVLGAALARAWGDESPVDGTIFLSGQPYRIVGVLADKQIDIQELEATGVNDSNQDLLIPLECLLLRTRLPDLRSEIDEIALQLATEDDLYTAGTAIQRLVTAAHNGVEDFQIVIPLDLLKQKQQSQRLLDILTICIASISLLVGGIGIMNIMLASVTERIREIGIRRAVGATRRDIRRQFLAESVVISSTGACAGVLLALLVVGVMSGVLLDLPIVISPFMVLVAVAAALATGLVFGIYPAVQAANRNPVEALRYE